MTRRGCLSIRKLTRSFSVDGVDSRQQSTELTVADRDGVDSRVQAQWLGGRVSESGSVVAESPIAPLIWN